MALRNVSAERKWRVFSCLAAAFLFIWFFSWFLAPARVSATGVTVAWDPNVEDGVAGYKVYYGPSGADYQVVDVGNVTSCSLSGLEEGRVYSLAATAYDRYGNESDFSETLTFNVPVTPSGPPVIKSFAVTPASIIEGETASLAWSVAGAGSVSIDNGIGIVNAVNGTIDIQPSASTAYTITATNAAGSASAVATVMVKPAAGLSAGKARISHAWTSFVIGEGYRDPVVIAGPPTCHEDDPGVVRLRNVASNSFEMRFQEWLYADGIHALEDIPYVVLDRGRHIMDDGSIWEVGAFLVDGTGKWFSQTFSGQFASPPALFLTIQTYNGRQPVTARARNVTGQGFEAALFEEEALMDGHLSEKVGYLAVWSPGASGTVTIGGREVPYLSQSVKVNHKFVPVLSQVLKLEEEQSRDAEVKHVDETIDVLALGNVMLAQDVSGSGGDTAALRRKAPEYEAAMEWGTVDGVDHNWLKIPFFRKYASPVVVVKPVSSHGAQPGVIRVRNVTPDSFELRYSEWTYLDGAHVGERVFYMVAESGTMSLAGLKVEAGTLDGSKLLLEGWNPVLFAGHYAETPAVFATVQTRNGSDPVTTRVSNRSAAGFDLTMDEEEKRRAAGHVTETIGWIAIENGSGTTVDKRSVMVSSVSADDSSNKIAFGKKLNRLFPFIMADIVSSHDSDPCFLRYRNLLPHGLELYIQEENSADSDSSHSVEDVSLFVAE